MLTGDSVICLTGASVSTPNFSIIIIIIIIIRQVATNASGTPPIDLRPNAEPAQVQEVGGDDVREGIHVDSTNEEEVGGSKGGMANFVMKWKDSKREASITVAMDVKVRLWLPCPLGPSHSLTPAPKGGTEGRPLSPE